MFSYNKRLAAALLLIVSFAASATLIAAVDENPVPVRTVKPSYPRELREAGVSGVVMVRCTIDEQGNVSDTSVLKSSNDKFDPPALEALKKWKFKPARQAGKPVAIQVTIPIKFVVDES